MGSGEGEEGETEESSEDETNPLSQYDPRGLSLDYEEDNQVTENNGGSGIGNGEGEEGESNNGGSGSGAGEGEGGEPKEPDQDEPDQLSQHPRSLTSERSIMTAAPHSTEKSVRYDTAQTTKSPEVARKFFLFPSVRGWGEAHNGST